MASTNTLVASNYDTLKTKIRFFFNWFDLIWNRNEKIEQNKERTAHKASNKNPMQSYVLET